MEVPMSWKDFKFATDEFASMLKIAAGYLVSGITGQAIYGFDLTGLITDIDWMLDGDAGPEPNVGGSDFQPLEKSREFILIYPWRSLDDYVSKNF